MENLKYSLLIDYVKVVFALLLILTLLSMVPNLSNFHYNTSNIILMMTDMIRLRFG